MPVRRAFAAAFALLMHFALVGCAGAEMASPYPTFDPAADEARQRTQADAALTRWADLLDASPQGYFILGPIGVGRVGQWENDNHKEPVGQVVAPGPIEGAAPSNAALRWADGTTAPVRALSAAQTLALAAANPVDCRGCDPTVVTGAQLTTTTISTSNGEATVPAWEFTLQGTAGRLVRAAVAADDFTMMPEPPWDSVNPPAGLSILSATAAADGRTLTTHFIGAAGSASEPCGIDYTAVPVESDRAVVVMIFTRSHGGQDACNMMGHTRSADAQLAAPLGKRPVLEVRTGMLVPVMRGS